MTSVLTSNAQQISSPQLPRNRHHSPKPVSTIEHAEDADDGQQAHAEHEGSPDLRLCDLDSPGQADADAQNDRREDIHQAADDQARAKAGSRGVEDGPCGNGICRSRLLTVWSWAEPVRGPRRRKVTWRGADPGADGQGLVGLWLMEHPAVASSQPSWQAQSAGLPVQPSARLPRPSRTSWCWTPQRTVSAGRGAPHARESKWTMAPLAPSGESKTGRFLGAQAANWVYGGAVSKGGASGLWNSEGRSIGAYSGPSSHVAMQFIVDAAQADAVSRESSAAQFG